MNDLQENQAIYTPLNKHSMVELRRQLNDNTIDRHYEMDEKIAKAKKESL